MDIYETVFERAPDPILVVNADGVIVRANHEAAKAFRYGAGELEGKSIESLIPARFVAAHPVHRNRYMAAPRTRPMGTGLKLEARRRDGTEFPVDIMLSFAETDQGPVAVASLRDVTESRRTEALLREAIERARLSAEAAGMGYWTYDEESGAFWCDGVCARHLGGRQEDFPDRESVRSRILPEDREARAQRVWASLDAYGVYESEFRVELPDGSIRWLRDLGRAVGGSAGGKGRQLAGVTYDISARKRAETAAQEAQQRERDLYEMAPDGIFLADLEGRYVDVNDAGCRLLGMAREDIVGKTILDLIPAEEAGRLAEVKRNLIGGRIDVSEWHLRHGNGSFVPVEVSAKIFPDGRWQGFVRDISERRRSEAKQAELVKSLQEALGEVKVLKGLLPICSHCKKIRDDSGRWQQLETYLHSRTNADFSHGICPECAQRFYAEFLPSGSLPKP